MREERLRQLLRETPLPEEQPAEDRGLRVVLAAYGRHAAAPAGRAWPRLALVLVGGLLALALLLSPAGAEVRDWIAEVVETDEHPARPALTRLPGGGELLVESPAGVSIVHADGTRRRLGAYEEGTWSPRGLFVAVARDRTLSAVDPLGNIRWSLSRPRPISDPRWSPYPGFRVAYLAGDSLRVVAGDGTGDRPLVPLVAAVAPAWRPGSSHVLVYGDPRGGLHTIDADRGRSLAQRGPAGPGAGALLALEWSTAGLLALYERELLLLDPRLRLLARVPVPPGGRFGSASFSPAGRAIAAILERLPAGGSGQPRSEVVLMRDGPSGLREDRVIAAPGSFTGLAWSPSGERLLVAWHDADQWLFLAPSGRGKVIAVGDIARQFQPGTTSAPGFPRIEGWCCTP
jgi:hypothetical protein